MNTVFCLMLAGQLVGQDVDHLLKDIPYCIATKDTLSKRINDVSLQRGYYRLAHKAIGNVRDAIEQARKSPVRNSEQREQRRARIKKLEVRVEELQKYLGTSHQAIPTIPIFQVEKGMVGELLGSNSVLIGDILLSDHYIKVFQVLDHQTMLVDVYRCDPSLNLSRFDKPIPFRVIGVDTTDIMDGQKTSLLGITFEALGTQQYKTVLGATRTIHVLKKIDMTPFKKEVDTYRLREWSDATGTFKTKATFVELYKGKVILVKENGITHIPHMSLG